MRKNEKVEMALLEQKLLPLYYHDEAETSISILQALYEGGIRIVEYTNRGEHAIDNFKALRKAADKRMPELILGIGTIKSPKSAKKFMEAGADFIICPSVNVDVAEVVASQKLLWIPGCMTPTEIANAENAGATLVKIFPGSLLGPSYISAIRDLFPGLKFMPTGGVEVELGNLEQWFRSGVVGVGMGSKLITKALIDKKDFAGIRSATEKALGLVRQASVV